MCFHTAACSRFTVTLLTTADIEGMDDGAPDLLGVDEGWSEGKLCDQ